VLRPDRVSTDEARSPPARSACFAHPAPGWLLGSRTVVLVDLLEIYNDLIRSGDGTGGTFCVAGSRSLPADAVKMADAEAVQAAAAAAAAVIQVPYAYGYVVLSVGVGTFLVTTMMGGPVMEARKRFNVLYPNLYAVPGYHKNADEFNRVQRGHQNMFESLSCVMVMTLLGGLKHPISCSVGYCLYLLGSYLYLVGYSDSSLDVKMARYKKGGGIKWVGVLWSMGSTVSLAGSMLGWW